MKAQSDIFTGTVRFDIFVLIALTQSGTGLPNEFHLFVFDPAGAVVFIEAREKDAVKVQHGKDGGRLPGVAERIDLPTNVWLGAREVKHVIDGSYK